MARPLWNGTITFGLLNVPVQIFSGERSVDMHFRLLDSRDKKPIRYERINSESGQEVAWKDVVKAFEFEKGNYVVVPEEEIRAAAPAATETVEIEAFVAADSIDPRYFEKPYYLVPNQKMPKGYVLLRDTLAKTGRIGIGKVVIRTRQYLSALMPQDEALVLLLMRFPQELVPASEFELPDGKPARYRITPDELKMASQLIESMTKPWRPEDYHDDFREQLHGIIQRRIAQQRGGNSKRTPAAEAAPKPSNVVDFVSLLKQSLAQNKRTPAARPRNAARPKKAAGSRRR